MRLKLQVAIVNTIPLNIRASATTSSAIRGRIPEGVYVIVNAEKKPGGGWTWHQLEDGRGWICHQEPGIRYAYTTVIENLEKPPAPPAPPPPPPPPPPPKPDYDAIKDAMDKNDNSKYDKDFENAFGKSSKGVYDAVPLNIPTESKSKSTTELHDYTIDSSFLGSSIERVKRNLNLRNNMEGSYLSYDLFKTFNRFRVPFADYNLTNTFSHVIFTRPDLNIIKNSGGGTFTLESQVENDPVYYYLYRNNKDLLLSLTRHFTASHDFLPFLSNAAQSFEVSDEFIKTVEHGETFTGYKLQYGKNLIESRTAGTFSINYTEDKLYSVYKIHKAWIDYISKVYRGELVSKKEYIKQKVLDYACSVYYIVTAADNETILFWTKYYGVFPTNAPSSASSWGKGGSVSNPEYSINYAYAFKEDFSPLSLAEFNMNSRTALKYRYSYEPTLGHSGTTLTYAPFIETSKDNSGAYIFKLKFRHEGG